jgi:hypothetical protein
MSKALSETCDPAPAFDVPVAEYNRLLGYPAGHEPAERARELAQWARTWYAQHGRPWIYLRRVDLQVTGNSLQLDGVVFSSQRLYDHIKLHQAQGAMLLAVSAGPECEEHARQLWNEGKPDEYFFLEMYGSAVVENLVARTSGRVCDLAAHQAQMAIPHYSPGYTGWDVAEQNKLFGLITQGRDHAFPGPLEVMTSGMLRPKKSLLAVFGLAPLATRGTVPSATTPCESCSFSPCQYRRAAYLHSGLIEEMRSPKIAANRVGPHNGPLTRDAKYSINGRALRKWAAERVRLHAHDDGRVEAVFRFDGTTCSNMGQALAFDYRITLSGPDDGYRILESSCLPTAGDEGYQSTCAYLANPERHLREIAADKPLLGRPIDEVLQWTRTSASAGCHCAADSRAHKWGLALEAIHYSLVQSHQPQPVAP